MGNCCSWPDGGDQHRTFPLASASTWVIHLGYGRFREHHEEAETLLNDLRINHLYKDGPKRKHDWHSGWLPEGDGATIKADLPKWRIDYVWTAGPIAKQAIESRPLYQGTFRLNIADQQSFALSDHLPQLAVFEME